MEDINDHAPQFVEAPYHVTVDELTPVGETHCIPSSLRLRCTRGFFFFLFSEDSFDCSVLPKSGTISRIVFVKSGIFLFLFFVYIYKTGNT